LERKRLSAVLRALADANRLTIFELLREGTYCNCEISERLELPANLVSHHLKALRRAGLLKTKHHPMDGRWVLYSLDREALGEVQKLMYRLFDPETVASRTPPLCRVGADSCSWEAEGEGELASMDTAQ